MKSSHIDIYDCTNIQTPPIGGKVFLIQRKGLFVFERGPATLRTIAIPHAGSGGLQVYDGVPNDEGLFPQEDMPEFILPGDGADPSQAVQNEEYPNRNGRLLFKQNPIVMGSWMMDAGCIHGLSIRALGGTDGTPAMATVVWMPFKKRTG